VNDKRRVETPSPRPIPPLKYLGECDPGDIVETVGGEFRYEMVYPGRGSCQVKVLRDGGDVFVDCDGNEFILGGYRKGTIRGAAPGAVVRVLEDEGAP